MICSLVQFCISPTTAKISSFSQKFERKYQYKNDNQKFWKSGTYNFIDIYMYLFSTNVSQV